MPAPRPINRRKALTLLGLSASGGVVLSKSAFAQAAGAANASSALLMDDADVCMITPETTEGPFYLDAALERVDITEGRPGLPLSLRLQVVDRTCAPQPGARVDVWHADAMGAYSGFQGSGGTFMRGTQFADDAGIADFQTVYPGWYPGRTPHIHFKVLLEGNETLTGQIFFPDAISDAVFASVAPYNTRGEVRRTNNANDGIATRATGASFAFVKELPDAYLAAMIIGVDPGA